MNHNDKTALLRAACRRVFAKLENLAAGIGRVRVDEARIARLSDAMERLSDAYARALGGGS
jgi:hypothetical protein